MKRRGKEKEEMEHHTGFYMFHATFQIIRLKADSDDSDSSSSSKPNRPLEHEAV